MKVLFVDRDGTLIKEPPENFQVDSLEKLELMDYVIPSLLKLLDFGFELVMITNQDGLGTQSFPQEDFDRPHHAMMQLFESQGIQFLDTLICPHTPEDACLCRKPHLGLVRPYLTNERIDLENSYVIGDRDSDMLLAQNMGISGIKIGLPDSHEAQWPDIVAQLTTKPRTATVTRTTNETSISISVNLDGVGNYSVSTGIGFFDHMLEQLSKHGGFDLSIEAVGDLHIDDHHTVEDVGITLGRAFSRALGDKRGIGRFGFLLPMDDSRAEIALDLSGRPFFVFNGSFPKDSIGEISCEMIIHFFRSFTESLGATLHMTISGENLHHMIEALFKGLARTLRDATSKTGGNTLPSTKGTL